MPEPDYFDRLLARRAGAVASEARPRLAGRFERAEPRWAEVTAPPRPAPPAPHPAPEAASPSLPWRDRVERHVEIHTETPAPPAAVPPPAPSLVISRTAPEPQRPTTAPHPQPAVLPRVAATVPAVAAASRPAPPTATRATSQDVPAPTVRAMPRTEQTPGVRRSAAPPPAARRRERPAEPAVHVRIGRLEVRATGTATGRAPARAARPGRQSPSVSLTDYLTAGRRP